MKIPRGTVSYFESKKRPMRFRGYKILSHHPEFNAATCVPLRENGKPIAKARGVRIEPSAEPGLLRLEVAAGRYTFTAAR